MSTTRRVFPEVLKREAVYRLLSSELHRKRSVSSACRCTPIGAMIGGWRSKQNKCPLAA